MTNMALEILLWFLAVQACGLAALPLASRLFRALPDRGYAFSKPLGLLLVAYLIWLPGMLGYLEYRRTTVLFVLVSLAAASWWRWGTETLVWLRTRPTVALVEEGIFLLAGLAALYVRSYNADIVGQEKFMDMAFFSGFLAATDLPAEDTWLAGYGMPYYPFGYLLLGVPAKLAGLPAAYAYNLALVLVFALTVLLSASLVANLVTQLRAEPIEDRPCSPVPSAHPGRGDEGLFQYAPTPGSADAEGRGVFQHPPTNRPGEAAPNGPAWGFGLLAAFFVAVCGNSVGPLELLAARGFGGPEFWDAVGVKNLRAAPSPQGWLPDDGSWWWHASRVIPTIQPDGITEFPYFSFLLGDLHPHFTSLPLLLLIAALAFALLLNGAPWRDSERLLLAALVLGVPIAANTWDVATFWTLYGLTAILVAWRSPATDQRLSWRPFAWALAPIPLGVLLFSPYFVGYSTQRLGLALVTDRTPLVSLLIIFGPFLLLAVMLAVRLLGPLRPGFPRPPWLLGLAGASLLLTLLLRQRWTAALCAALLALVAVAGWRQVVRWREEPTPGRTSALFLTLLPILALAVIVGAELVYVVDAFGTRMNTVFKFYYHVWLLLGLLGAPALFLWLRTTNLGAPTHLARIGASAVLGFVVALGMVYPLAATWAKSGGFRGPATLDGAAFLSRSRSGDAAAIRWLAKQAPARPVVLEAVGDDYQEFARVSTFSGLPTVIGWIGHQEQWRGRLDEYDRRRQDVEKVYQGAEQGEVQGILARYGVRYVVVGSLEREKYGPQTEERLARWLTPVFQQEGAVIFAVPHEARRL